MEALQFSIPVAHSRKLALGTAVGTGVAVGMALQGALSNLAGGIMILIFKPFSVGDYVEAAGVSGTVQAITPFYSAFLSVDNKRIVVPNGNLMNASVVDYSSQAERRVDLIFGCGRGEDPDRVKALILAVLREDERVLQAPEAPFVRLSAAGKEGLDFTVRVWCRNKDYWSLYYDLLEGVTRKLREEQVSAPALRLEQVAPEKGQKGSADKKERNE